MLKKNERENKKKEITRTTVSSGKGRGVEGGSGMRRISPRLQQPYEGKGKRTINPESGVGEAQMCSR